MTDTRLRDFLKELEDIPGFTSLSNISVNSTGGFGETPLHVAAIRGDVAIIHLLIEAGASLNSLGEHGYTPLHEAASQGHLPAVKALLEGGALPNLKTDDGWSYLEFLQHLHPEKAEQGAGANG